jgi:hypothetical protein
MVRGFLKKSLMSELDFSAALLPPLGCVQVGDGEEPAVHWSEGLGLHLTADWRLDDAACTDEPSAEVFEDRG